jgi:hypothetical protein
MAINVTFLAVKRSLTTPGPGMVIKPPGASGLLGLIEATSNLNAIDASF